VCGNDDGYLIVVFFGNMNIYFKWERKKREERGGKNEKKNRESVKE